MSSAVRDLPDPLEPSPGLPTSSPDDLLSKMADAAIDEMMAADRPARRRPAPDDAATSVDEAAHAIAPGDEPAEAPPADARPAVAVDPVPAAGPPSVSVGDHPRAAGFSSPPADPPPPAADVRALLAEPPAPASPALWPLRVVNAPFAWMGDGVRKAVGVLALASIVPAACAVVYVIYFKRS